MPQGPLLSFGRAPAVALWIRRQAAWRSHGLMNAAILGSSLAGILLGVACLQVLLPLERYAMRAHPLYWLVLVPAAAWAAAAANFKVWAD